MAISPVDHGTLYLTREEFVFVGARRRLKFLLTDLTHLSATHSGIALGMRERGAFSYFTGIEKTPLKFCVEPAPGEYFPGLVCTFRLTGYEVEEIVHLLQTASITNPA